MEIKIAKQKLKDLKLLHTQYEEANKKQNEVCTCHYEEGKGWVRNFPEEFKLASNNLRKISQEYHKAQKDFLDYIGNIEIQNPNEIIAGRTTTGYRGKLESFYVNDLTHIHLSDKKQEGNVKMPYKLDLNGVAKRVNETYYYRIKRIDGKVYWIPSISDFDLRY